LDNDAFRIHGERMTLYVERLIIALREGGFDLGTQRGLNLFGGITSREDKYRLFEGQNKGYFFNIDIESKVDAEGKPLYARVVADLGMPGSISAGVTVSRRTDHDVWEADAYGTFHLPIGHALGELAHNAKFLGLAKDRMHATLDDHRFLLGMMEMGRIFRVAP